MPAHATRAKIFAHTLSYENMLNLQADLEYTQDAEANITCEPLVIFLPFILFCAHTLHPITHLTLSSMPALVPAALHMYLHQNLCPQPAVLLYSVLRTISDPSHN